MQITLGLDWIVDFIDSRVYEEVIIVGDFDLPDIKTLNGFIDPSPTLFMFCE